MITVNGNEDSETIAKMQEYKAKGVIYELSDDETYFVDTPLVETKIKRIVSEYK